MDRTVGRGERIPVSVGTVPHGTLRPAVVSLRVGNGASPVLPVWIVVLGHTQGPPLVVVQVDRPVVHEDVSGDALAAPRDLADHVDTARDLDLYGPVNLAVLDVIDAMIPPVVLGYSLLALPRWKRCSIATCRLQ